MSVTLAALFLIGALLGGACARLVLRHCTCGYLHWRWGR